MCREKKLDVIANIIMKVGLCCSQRVSIVVSEEDAEPCLCSDVTDFAAFSNDFAADFAAVFDPLDGSSNAYCGLPAGTMFSTYRKPSFEDSVPI